MRFADAAATGNVQETKLRVKQINRTGNEKPRKHKLRNRVTAGIGTIVIALGVGGGITGAGHEQSHHYSSPGTSVETAPKTQNKSHGPTGRLRRPEALRDSDSVVKFTSIGAGGLPVSTRY